MRLEARGKRQETRGKKQEAKKKKEARTRSKNKKQEARTRSKKQEARSKNKNKKQEARSKKQEARSKKREARSEKREARSEKKKKQVLHFETRRKKKTEKGLTRTIRSVGLSSTFGGKIVEQEGIEIFMQKSFGVETWAMQRQGKVIVEEEEFAGKTIQQRDTSCLAIIRLKP
ncbi:hypothetical protein VNO77_17406 [Canavalia gladiata]|uniref:Uncharacterized protein n=1 Tax=Canavalia gladiata TaxID=3824 RepID=A0AAN9LJ46_CANGL